MHSRNRVVPRSPRDGLEGGDTFGAPGSLQVVVRVVVLENSLECVANLQ
jgi:hypothetical protein